MKKVALTFLLAIFLFSSFAFVTAESCDLDISMINQDPYPAIPGDYVKIVFQVNGLDNPECKNIQFELLEQYPLVFDPDLNPIININAGTYSQDFSSFLIAPYKVRVDENALDGETPIEIKYRYGLQDLYLEQEFSLNVKDSRADFEVYVKEYDLVTKELIFEILNTAKSDVEALTLEVPKQSNVVIKGPKTNIIGDLDSNDYTTASFEAIPSKGEITIKISYTDSINMRRSLEKTVMFEPEYFEDRTNGKQKTSIWLMLFWILVVIFVIRYFYKRRKAKKKLREKRK